MIPPSERYFDERMSTIRFLGPRSRCTYLRLCKTAKAGLGKIRVVKNPTGGIGGKTSREDYPGGVGEGTPKHRKRGRSLLDTSRRSPPNFSQPLIPPTLIREIHRVDILNNALGGRLFGSCSAPSQKLRMGNISSALACLCDPSNADISFLHILSVFSSYDFFRCP